MLRRAALEMAWSALNGARRAIKNGETEEGGVIGRKGCRGSARSSKLSSTGPVPLPRHASRRSRSWYCTAALA